MAGNNIYVQGSYVDMYKKAVSARLKQPILTE